MDFRGKKIFMAVINDLVTDQRVHRAAYTMRSQGATVVLLGRRKKDSLPMSSRAYRTVRFRLPFETGPLFYAAYNIRLFFFLLFKKFDLIYANDLDTLPACFLVSRLHGKPLVYDSHEYFTEVPELVHRPKIQRFWKRVERLILPRLKSMITVNKSIAKLYEKEYGILVHVVRNLPMTDHFSSVSIQQELTREQAGLPHDKSIFLLQGAGINKDRGAEEAVEAMQWVDNGLLVIIGGGDVLDQLKRRVSENNLKGKVMFIPKMTPQELRRYTRLADFGLTLDKDTNLNYRFSLPNKLFDYINAGIPVIASDLPEIRKVVEHYNIGTLVPSIDPKSLAQVMNDCMQDKTQADQWKTNIPAAQQALNWDQEKEKFLTVFQYV